jgi:hypothetical protein
MLEHFTAKNAVNIDDVWCNRRIAIFIKVPMPSGTWQDRLQLRSAHCTASPGLFILRQERYRRRRSLNTRGSLRGSKAIWITMRQTPCATSSATFPTRSIADNG